MRHDDAWYAALARELEHTGYVTLAEVRQAEAREARETAATVTWTHHRGEGDYTASSGGGRYLIMRDGDTWRVSAWPSGDGSEGAVRRITHVRTLAEAKGLALAHPCFRCGLASPLTAMTPVLPERPGQRTGPRPRYRCLDESACLAERGRLTGTEPARIKVRQESCRCEACADPGAYLARLREQAQTRASRTRR